MAHGEAKELVSDRVPITLKGLLRLTVFTVVAVGIVIGLQRGLSIPQGIVYLVFGINWAVGVVSVILDTEHVFDLTGSLTYLATIAFSLFSSDAAQPLIQNPVKFLNELAGQSEFYRTPIVRPVLASILSLVWALRLGTFLFTRINRVGKDVRFDEIKKNRLRFLNVWTVQGLWVFFTALSVFTMNSQPLSSQPNLNFVDAIGFGLWFLGFGIEVLADSQKTSFNSNPANKDRFIRTGLWSLSRHPNYCGEIMLWIGIFVVGSRTFTGMAWTCVLSPCFVILLLTKVSGVPMLEQKSDSKWGGQSDYEAYKAKTPILLPGFSCGAKDAPKAKQS